MARIDTSLIEGYEAMSAEEKLKALEALDLPDPDYSGYVKKDVFDATASELAKKKKELRERMSEDEQKKQKDAEERADLQNKYDELLRKSNISDAKADLVALGYDETLAQETAEAMVDGDRKKVFENQKKFKASLEKKIRADVLRDTPAPDDKGKGKNMTIDDLRKMAPGDRYKFSQEHPEEYKALYGG